MAIKTNERKPSHQYRTLIIKISTKKLSTNIFYLGYHIFVVFNIIGIFRRYIKIQQKGCYKQNDIN